MIPSAAQTSISTLTDRLDAALPQTQCTRCGYADCRHYAQALATGEADINRCPPGGAQGVERLGLLTGRPPKPIDPDLGAEGPLKLAFIVEAECIGCTLCIQACPVDCIIGANKLMHTVVDDDCTGCELCVPACPVDCIAMRPVSGTRTGWAAWSAERAEAARQRYAFRSQRIERDRRAHDERLAARTTSHATDASNPPSAVGGDAADLKRTVLAAAQERALARRVRR